MTPKKQVWAILTTLLFVITMAPKPVFADGGADTLTALSFNMQKCAKRITDADGNIIGVVADPAAKNMTIEEMALWIEGKWIPANLYTGMNASSPDIKIAREIAIQQQLVMFNDINNETGGWLCHDPQTKAPKPVTIADLPAIWRAGAKQGFITLEFETPGVHQYQGIAYKNGQPTGGIKIVSREAYKDDRGEIVEKCFKIQAAGKKFKGSSAMCANNPANIHEGMQVLMPGPDPENYAPGLQTNEALFTPAEEQQVNEVLKKAQTAAATQGSVVNLNININKMGGNTNSIPGGGTTGTSEPSVVMLQPASQQVEQKPTWVPGMVTLNPGFTQQFSQPAYTTCTTAQPMMTTQQGPVMTSGGYDPALYAKLDQIEMALTKIIRQNRGALALGVLSTLFSGFTAGVGIYGLITGNRSRYPNLYQYQNQIPNFNPVTPGTHSEFASYNTGQYSTHE